MVVNGPWLKNFIDKFAPDIEWGVTACPAYPGVADDARFLAECVEARHGVRHGGARVMNELALGS